MKWLDKIIERIVEKKFSKIIASKLERIETLLSYFETGVDVHVYKESLIIMLRKDKPQIKFWAIKDIETVMKILNDFHIHSNRIIFDTKPGLSKLLEDELYHKRRF